MEIKTTYFPSLEKVRDAAARLDGIAIKTPFSRNARFSKMLQCEVFFKREDLQNVRSYKIRGAYYKMVGLAPEERAHGVVCASAGNHAQGVALSCKLLKIKGTIYMPTTTPDQKIEQVQLFGESFVTVLLKGDTFDDAQTLAKLDSKASGKAFIPPFDDEKIIEGQATVGLEILEQTLTPLDYVFVPIGGGGLSAGLSSVFKYLSPKTKIIGVEPEGAPSMKVSLALGENTSLKQIEKFVDGAAVKRVGDLNYTICRETLDSVITVPEGKICETMLALYNKDAIIVEPAGALSIAALDLYADMIKGKAVACVVSGSNNDITRTAEIKERALLYGQIKHYFIVKFPQRVGALREFLTEVVGPNDDITHFEYTKKTNRENGAAVVGLELKSPEDLEPLVARMKNRSFFGDYLNNKPELFQFLV
ncbi:MAG: threonine ammonia-lyase IlvA [Bacteroidetes bacterium]|nr:threonine ammonia-lyase IlvA [Bacteroidota bacterium]